MKKNILLVGIAGKKRAGKDTWAAGVWRQVLEAGLGSVRRRYFADALKQEVAEFVGERITGSASASWFPSRNVVTVMDCLYSADPAEKEPYRLLMQWWGTEFRRRWFGDDYWVRALEEWLTTRGAQPSGPLPAVCLVPDVRFPNEAAFIRSQGGLLVRVDRPDLPVDLHPSETALDEFTGWDWQFLNDSGLPSVEDDVRRFIAQRLCPALDQ